MEQIDLVYPKPTEHLGSKEKVQRLCEIWLETLVRNLKSNDDFIFLEVNPVGQFGMTSSPCNYSLEKKIAQHFYNNQKSKI